MAVRRGGCAALPADSHRAATVAGALLAADDNMGAVRASEGIAVMENSKIAWTDHTWNPWMGCTKVSPGCANCYAEALMDKRFGKVQWGPEGERVKTSKRNWLQLRQWDVKAGNSHKRVFVSSLADFFEDRPELVEWRNKAMRMMRETYSLNYLILTKRPENVMGMVPAWWRGSWPQWVWIGTSVESQDYIDTRLSPLRGIPGKHFVSAEPLIAPMIPNGYEEVIDWLIVGGESGNNKTKTRPMDPAWARSLRDWSQTHSIPFFMKQMGAWLSYDGHAGMDHNALISSSASGKQMSMVMEWHGGHGDDDAIPPDLRIRQTPFDYVEE